MRRYDGAGPAPPSRARLERIVAGHVAELLRPPQCLDEDSRPPLLPLLLAHREWRLAGLPPPRPASPPAPGRAGAVGVLRLVVAVTFLGDLATIFVAVSVVVAAPLLVTALLVLALTGAAAFLAHETGRWLHRRQHRAERLPGALAAALALTWLGLGTAAAVLRLAAPLTAASGFGAATDTAAGPAATTVLLAALMLVLYLANGLSAAVLGHRTAGHGDVGPTPSSTLAQRRRERRRRRLEVRRARHEAYFRVLAAETALALAVGFRTPSATDALTAPLQAPIPEVFR